jgi:hypothetical protein
MASLLVQILVPAVPVTHAAAGCRRSSQKNLLLHPKIIRRRERLQAILNVM